MLHPHWEPWLAESGAEPRPRRWKTSAIWTMDSSLFHSNQPFGPSTRTILFLDSSTQHTLPLQYYFAHHICCTIYWTLLHYICTHLHFTHSHTVLPPSFIHIYSFIFCHILSSLSHLFSKFYFYCSFNGILFFSFLQLIFISWTLDKTFHYMTYCVWLCMW